MFDIVPLRCATESLIIEVQKGKGHYCLSMCFCEGWTTSWALAEEHTKFSINFRP